MDNNHHIEFLQQTLLFADLKPAELDNIAQDIVPRHYQQGDIVFYEGDPGQCLYLIQSGQVRIFVNGLDGSETSVILFGRPGEIFGELAVVDGLPRSATAVALGNTTLYTMSRENFREHTLHYPQLALNFMKVLSSRVRSSTVQMDSLATLDVPQRLARKLLQLAQDYGIAQADGVHIKLQLTQTDLASLVGATRESINKALRDFRQQDWLHTQQGKIIILDAEALHTQVTS
jgi:CRP/FNR family transcriptional regulator/CRP/FNR family cyclic AMP-dependent transcriptional regulator